MVLLLYFPNTAVKYSLVEKETDESSIAGEAEPIIRLLMSIRLHFSSCRAAQTRLAQGALRIQVIHLQKWVCGTREWSKVGKTERAPAVSSERSLQGCSTGKLGAPNGAFCVLEPP